MTRKKVKLTFIANDSERKTSFKKRKKGLLKKVSELSTLCDVDACALIFSPYDGHDPEVWPSHPGAQRVLARFQKMPELEQNRKMVNQETFIRQRIRKAEEQLKKQQGENRRKEIGHIISQCFAGVSYQSFNVMDLNDTGFVLAQNLMEINMRIESLKGDHQNLDQNIAQEIPTNEVQNFEWNMEMPRLNVPPTLGWDNTFLPYAENSDDARRA